MAKEIPIPYVRANQWGIVSFVVLSVVLQQPLIIVLLLLLQASGLIYGAKGNLFIQITKPFVAKLVAKAPTEAVELQRFNNSIAVILLLIASLAFLRWEIVGYIAAGMVAVAAFAAICGFCIGCVIYYQFKQWKTRHTILK